jgi:hypothetical protein
MKLAEIQPGMQGEGKTIFKDTKIETFKFKVLGFIEKFVPDKNLIIVEIKSPVLEGGGILEGMSGSPLYINGKIIGAVSYGFSFSKKPIAGVTPIEDIIKTSDYNNQTFFIDISNIKVEFDKKNIKNVVRLIQKELTKRINFSPVNSISSIKLISTNKGINPSALSYLKPVFTPLSNIKFSKNIKKDSINSNLFKISEGDAASIPLIKGDFEYSASGTVSYVDGKKIYLFGHPFFNLGTVDFPLHKAEIISVVPSYQSGFKLATSKNMIGTVLQDRFSGVQGELGGKPYMIPLKVFLKNRNRKFDIEIVNHPLLTPSLSAISLMNILSSEYQQYGFQSLRVKGKIFIENEKNVILDDLYSGMDSSYEFTNLILAINFFLMNNREKRIKIQKIDFEISSSETIRRTSIENVIINKNSFIPGEIVSVKLIFKNERGNRRVKKINVKAPNLKPGSNFYLMVADKDEMASFDSKNIKSSYFPIKLSSLIRAINNLRKNNRVYFKILAPVKSLFIKGYEYSNLPQSLRNIFIFNSSSNVQSEMKYSTLMEYQMEVPAVVKGKKLFKLKIKER